jgi:O-glycosyl hydrolase
MTEVSHGEAPALGFDLLRGRAIHIHDELVYADAAAFFAMNNVWDLVTHRDHFKGRGGDAPDALYTEMDTVVLIDNEKAAVHITGMGYAIGHYARWLRRGAVRLEAESADPLVQVTAFRGDSPKRLVLVIINNSQHAQTVLVDVKGLGLSGKVTGEQSTEKAFWKALEPRETTSAVSFAAALPPLSVTSLAAPLAGAPTAPAGR